MLGKAGDTENIAKNKNNIDSPSCFYLMINGGNGNWGCDFTILFAMAMRLWLDSSRIIHL
jgi:hypothetical protein